MFPEEQFTDDVYERWRLRNGSIAEITNRKGSVAAGTIDGSNQVHVWDGGVDLHAGRGYDLVRLENIAARPARSGPANGARRGVDDGMNCMNLNLEAAILRAAQWHAGQKDKAGQPYILHPLSVMFRVRRAGHSEEAQIAAVLHDVLEDCEVDRNDIDHYFGAEVADAVDALTRREGEGYEQFIERVKLNAIARIVKLADIEDNLDPQRLREVEESSPHVDMYRLKCRYRRARVVLLEEAAS